MKKISILVSIVFLVVESLFAQCPDYMSITTQQQVDEFPINNPNCNEINGYVEINGEDITNLHGLSSISSINGSLVIYYSSLIDLSGLDNLTHIGGYLIIQDNDQLYNLTGLGKLTTISDYLYIGSNSSLNSLSGMENLSSVEGWQFGIYDNQSLVELASFKNLKSIQGILFIEGNRSLTTLQGLDSLMTIGGSVSIFGCGSLTDLNGLGNLNTIGEGLVLSDLYSAENINGLHNLTHIGGSLIINKCNSLVNLSGLNKLTEIGGSLHIIENNKLKSLSGLNNIKTESIEHLIITFNPFLATCHVESICNYLADPNGDLTIHSNSAGCNNYVEVETSCSLNTDEIALNEPFTIYPNPAKNAFYIKSEHELLTVRIFNQLGQVIISETGNIRVVDISSLTSGLYYVHLTSDKSNYNTILVVD